MDFVANAASLGAHAVRAKTGGELRAALVDARKRSETTVVVVETAMDSASPAMSPGGMSRSRRLPILPPCERLAASTESQAD